MARAVTGGYSRQTAPTGETSFRMPTYRLAVGLRYTHVRYVGTATNTMP